MVVVPAFVFAVNWALRSKGNYGQTAAADFILATLIFDLTVITSAKQFEPFIRNIYLREIAVEWHFCIGVVGAFTWWFITKYGEPRVTAYYSRTRNRPKKPIGTLMICWMAIFMLVSIHVGFFVVRGGAHG